MMLKLKQFAIVAGIGMVGIWASSGLVKKFPLTAGLGLLVLGYLGRAWIGAKVAGLLPQQPEEDGGGVIEMTESQLAAATQQSLEMPAEKPGHAYDRAGVAAAEDEGVQIRGYFDSKPNNPWS